MSAAVAPAAPRRLLKLTQGRVLVSELTKFRSLRSTIWTLLTAVVFTIGLSAILSAVNSIPQHSTTGPTGSFNPVTTSLNGIIFAIVAFGVLGVLMISGEYGTGIIRSSLTAAPRRLPVLWGKLAVFAAVIFPASLITSLISFFLGQALLDIHHHYGVSLTAGGALQSVIGAALYMTVAGRTGVALGTLFRDTAAGISIFTGMFLVLPMLARILRSSVKDHVAQYLPSNAGDAVWGGASDIVTRALSRWTGFAVLCGYAAVLIIATAWRLRRSDA